MPMQLDTGAIKAESRSLLRTGEVNPFRMTLFYLLITLVLDMINSGVSYMIDSAGGFTVLSFSFVSILVGLGRARSERGVLLLLLRHPAPRGNAV